MHARYYDPEAGRFIMKDPVSGSLSNPITHGFRIKCGMTKRRSANDPVNKIDPGGDQFNSVPTVIRPQFFPDVIEPPPKPPNCYNTCGSNMMVITPNGLPGNRCRSCIEAGFASSLTGEGCGETVCQIEGDDLYNYYLAGGVSDDPTIGSTDNPAVVSTVLSGGLGSLAAITDTPDSGIIEQPNKDYDIKYEIDEFGNVTTTPVDKNGNPVKLTESEQKVLDAIQNGMNDAIKWLGDQGFMGSFSLFLPGIFRLKVLDFINEYSSAFYRIMGGVTPENAYELGYNATVRIAISYQMVQYSDKSFNEYDRVIGFWVSFWSRKSGLAYDVNENPNGIKFYGDAQHLGLLDVANLNKAIIHRESTFDPYSNKGSGLASLMGIPYGGTDKWYDFIVQFGGPTGFARTGAVFLTLSIILE